MHKIIRRDVDLAHQRVIAQAIIQYTRKHDNHLPADLKALVDSGDLPKTSEIYLSPYDGGNGMAIPYSSSSYVLTHDGGYIKRMEKKESILKYQE